MTESMQVKYAITLGHLRFFTLLDHKPLIQLRFGTYFATGGGVDDRAARFDADPAAADCFLFALAFGALTPRRKSD